MVCAGNCDLACLCFVRIGRIPGVLRWQHASPHGFPGSEISFQCFSRLQKQVIQPLNGDPFIGMLETPVTSAPIVANYLSNLPIYRTGVSPLLRGVEIGLAHGFLMAGPFIKVKHF